MPAMLVSCARLLATAGIRHHLDHDEGVIRVVFTTRRYRNPRGEHLAIVTLDAAGDGRSCRARIERAFPAGRDPAAACLDLCRLAGEFPGVGFRYDDDSRSISLTAIAFAGGGRITAAQLCGLLDAVVVAAETCHRACEGPEERRRRVG
ncbi:MAG: hypothetical protein ACKO4T_05995 [Planctomycetaceae bacterium]